MSRSGLDYTGRTAPTFISRQTCSTLIIIVATYLSLNVMILILATNDYIVYGEFPPSWQLISCFVTLNIVFIVYTYYTIGATRASLRSKYMISERRCGRYEDCCCALFCTFCTITQMGRHTGDYHTFRGVCCNSSGLPQHVTIPRNPDAMFYEKMHDVDASNKLVI
jgi:Cys-rich protein (TIGR01571 family)